MTMHHEGRKEERRGGEMSTGVMRILIVGNGKMGRTLATLAEERGHAVHGILGRDGERALKGVDVALEFTRPEAAAGNVRRLIEAGIPTVSGTTGWDAARPEVAELVRARGGAFLYAANFSVGVHLFLRAAKELACQFAGREEFGGFIAEEHHAGKRDAPSGTALLLQKRLRDADPGRDFPITSVRAGATPGTHELTYEGQYERITLTHVARSREVFAVGALAAAEWLRGRTGVFGIEDMLFGGPG
jgi:4-hydroxy-tetrahydrodipicolinate reductase